MKKIITQILLILCIVLCAVSCEKKNVVLEEPSQGLIDSINVVTSSEFNDTIVALSVPASKGTQWKAWQAWFKNCSQNQTFQKDIIYLGASSSKGLGYILSKDKSIDKIDFFKICKDPSVLNSFINNGAMVSQCDLSKMNESAFDMMIDGNFLKTVNAQLGALVSNARKITIKSGSWRIESIETVPFLDYINSSTDPAIVNYRKHLISKKNVVLTKVLKIYGFEAEIETNDTINTSLKATLENGLNINVVPIDDTNKIGFDLKFKKTSANIVKVSSKGEISVFAQASKGNKI
ncbi:hypothetical protein [uncultured Flavobacterium sp.]|uniref:hypothetical protein n=1 Tax=uncultured Flavobacterium sp. TaxID=165435 RepID=UPI0030812BEA